MTDAWTWLLAPLSGASTHFISATASWHGRLMVLCWAFAVPLAVLLARFFKVMPGQRWPQVLDNPFWWHAHRLLNGLALATSGLAVVLVLLAPATPAPSTTADARAWHALLGWSLLACGLVQLLGGWLRGSKGGPTAPRLDAQGQPIDWHGDHYDMSPRRYAFERLHKSLGYLALLLSVLTLGLGLWHADAPRWMALALGLWWLLLGSAFVRLQSLGRCIDTYQAIWGPGPEHPGNHKPVVGWGIQRVVSTQGQE